MFIKLIIMSWAVGGLLAWGKLKMLQVKRKLGILNSLSADHARDKANTCPYVL